MDRIYEVTGELTDSRHLTLDANPDPGEFEESLRARQIARGHVPRTKEEIDACLDAERKSWD